MSVGVLIDSNVLIDLTHADDSFFEWSLARVQEAVEEGSARINPLIYAEVAATLDPADHIDDFLWSSDIERLPLPYEAAIPAGLAYRAYRRCGGTRTSPLPDFYIGAHAQVEGLRVLTRDVQRYRTYFPDVELIAPD